MKGTQLCMVNDLCPHKDEDYAQNVQDKSIMKSMAVVIRQRFSELVNIYRFLSVADMKEKNEYHFMCQDAFDCYQYISFIAGLRVKSEKDVEDDNANSCIFNDTKFSYSEIEDLEESIRNKKTIIKRLLKELLLSVYLTDGQNYVVKKIYSKL